MSDPIYTVTEVNRIARGLLESRLSNVQIEGEISTLSRPGSGHWYFTLKDETAQIRCAMFRNRNYLVNFKPAQGDLVHLTGKVSLFEARGEYQLIVEEMTAAGTGQLLIAFEKLKQKLQAEGLFDTGDKQALPILPKRIAIVTSPTGAAIQDMLHILNRRYPLAEVLVHPVQVQGEAAAAQIANAINAANQQDGTDVIIVGRGGGSIEDLWAFNEETVARAIYASQLPIISAVGHETDFTIADFVADVRAPTPSAAAEIVAPHQDELRGQMEYQKERLSAQLAHHLKEKADALAWMKSRLVARHPLSRLEQQRLRVDHLRGQLQSRQVEIQKSKELLVLDLTHRLQRQDPLPRIAHQRAAVTTLEQQASTYLHARLARHRARLADLTATLHAISPLRTLQRGYSITLDERGKPITAVDQVQTGQRITTQLSDGQFDAIVKEKA